MLRLLGNENEDFAAMVKARGFKYPHSQLAIAENNIQISILVRGSADDFL